VEIRSKWNVEWSLEENKIIIAIGTGGDR